ncbi:MAG: NAD-dependent epimerase/dehydratase family protein [Phototrophicales bacterium]|nr:MAG: NAD-dependent epimerase/dehydratase family protein [Chloroflexota bacterium]
MFFLTGGTGFLGRHLVAALCRRHDPVRVLTRYPEEHSWLKRYPNVQVIQGDLVDKSTLIRGIAGCRYVIHAGGFFRFWGDKQVFMQTNALGTLNMLEAAKAEGVERFIHISSIAVIGEPDPTNVIDESYPPKPVEPYQESKYEGEQMALRYYQEFGLPVIVLRPGAFYGPLGHYAFNRLFFKDAMRGIIMQIDGGKHIIFPAYITDVVEGIFLALERGRVGEIYNICGDWISHREAFDIICEQAKLHWPRPPIPGWLGITASRILELFSRITRREPFWPINMRSYVYNDWRVSNEKARRELGFSPTPFEEGARRTIQWYKNGQPEDIPEIRCDGSI